MGGFEGGDEGGFWDEDTHFIASSKQKHAISLQKKPHISTTSSGFSIKAHAKINLFYKITACENKKISYISRLMQLPDLYDTLSFVRCECKRFTIEGCELNSKESNAIHAVYEALLQYTQDSEIEEFFYSHKVVLQKRIPSDAGLGAPSSNAAAFLHLSKLACNLVLSTEELLAFTDDITTAFFLHNYSVANISSESNAIEPLDEKPLEIEYSIKPLSYSTNYLQQKYHKELLKKIGSFEELASLDSRALLCQISNAATLNDLYEFSLREYKELQELQTHNGFMWGALCFRLKH